MNYTEAEKYLKEASARGIKLGMERITELCRRLGQPQEKVRIIHLTGTNGKGSFGAMLSAILTAAGICTGSFSSPALTGVTDSFQVSGKRISPERFAEIMTEVAAEAEAMDDKPTEFELMTACAYLMFEMEKCETAIVECGMGGDTDSTNIISSPLLSVITNAALDHSAFLGDTVPEIAAHKAGIIKPGRPVLFCGDDISALEVIKLKAEEMKAPLTICKRGNITGEEYKLSGTVLTHRKYGELKLGMLGSYQLINAENVLAAVEILESYGISIGAEAVKEGMKNAVLPARFELLSRNKEPAVIYDGAHNPHGMAQAADSIRRYFPGKKAVLLMGVMADKKYEEYGEMLRDITDMAFTVKPENPRSLDSKKLAEALGAAGIKAEWFEDFGEGVKAAVGYARANKLPLVVLGTLYMYGQFKGQLEGLM